MSKVGDDDVLFILERGGEKGGRVVVVGISDQHVRTTLAARDRLNQRLIRGPVIDVIIVSTYLLDVKRRLSPQLQRLEVCGGAVELGVVIQNKEFIAQLQHVDVPEAHCRRFRKYCKQDSDRTANKNPVL